MIEGIRSPPPTIFLAAPRMQVDPRMSYSAQTHPKAPLDRDRYSLPRLNRNALALCWRGIAGRGLAVALGILLTLLPAVSQACPFCESVQQTIRQQSLTMDAVVIASSVDSHLTRNLDTGIVKMKIHQVLRGGELVKVDQVIDAIYYGDVKVGRRFLLSGVDPPELQWSCLPLTEDFEKYIIGAINLKEDPLSRLRYFRKFLENDDRLISRDAYDEFASTPYEEMMKLGAEMDHDRLVEWVQNPEIGADRRRLYFTMLGICGSKDDLPMLEAQLRTPTKSVSSGLDALIACYLTLAGEKGLPLINELFITNKKAPFKETYAAIMAIRFHGTDGGVIPRSALVESLHAVLERPELADMVIPDLAKWDDWSQVNRMVKLFKDADEKKNWVRVPVVNYLRACPLPEAQKAIEVLEKIDPGAVQRSKAFFPIPIRSKSDGKDDQASRTRKERFEKSKRALVSETRSDKARPVGGLPINGTSLKVADASFVATGDATAKRNHSDDAPQLTTVASIPGAKLLGSRILPNQLNPWNLTLVMVMGLASLCIGIFLVLTGGRVFDPPKA